MASKRSMQRLQYLEDAEATRILTLDAILEREKRVGVQQVVLDALVALWTDRRSDKHAELYAEAMAALNEWIPPEVC